MSRFVGARNMEMELAINSGSLFDSPHQLSQKEKVVLIASFLLF